MSRVAKSWARFKVHYPNKQDKLETNRRAKRIQQISVRCHTKSFSKQKNGKMLREEKRSMSPWLRLLLNLSKSNLENVISYRIRQYSHKLLNEQGQPPGVPKAASVLRYATVVKYYSRGQEFAPCYFNLQRGGQLYFN